MKHTLAILTVVGLGSAAFGQTFVNGDFTGGDLTGWTITPTANGQTLTQDVIQFDIDFAGPLGVSNVARFRVGQVAFQSGVPAGIGARTSSRLEPSRPPDRLTNPVRRVL